MDCSIVATRHAGVSMISTTDFFYPLVDDPYMQGRIACANVLSDLYAMGVVDCDTLLMLLAASTDMEAEERHIVTKLMMRGFNDAALEAGTKVTGGQTVLNPWPIIGGVATSFSFAHEFIRPEQAVAGDVLVLTKPLGTQVAVNVNQWRYIDDKWLRVDALMTKQDAEDAYEAAMRSMARLNRNAARLMHQFGAHGATDVTGFGILGHARNLAKNQLQPVRFEIDTLPIIRHMRAVEQKVNIFKLLAGLSAETSGGLLVCLPAAAAAAFCQALQQLDGEPAWIIGRVVASTDDVSGNTAVISSTPEFIDV
eukprot:TRINITY_DN339_c1_g1_i2.p2 TRINITY_DN339_c1_g1~~TRINITY_DN339_c1_g1_i2.p2  ORF type:complete len:310 (-),score=146.83 TRINITY_DN339_c1_g1_i2:342-1271(-)